MKYNIILFSAALALYACQTESTKPASIEPKNATENASDNKISVESSNVELNAIASFLGGNQPKSAGDYSTAFANLEWKNHQSLLSNAWSKALVEKVVPMRDWSKN